MNDARPSGSRSGVLYIRGLPVDLKLHFKAYCAKRGISMTAAIEKWIRSLIKESK